MQHLYQVNPLNSPLTIWYNLDNRPTPTFLGDFGPQVDVDYLAKYSP